MNDFFELAPREGNPRNSEGAFITLKNGDLLFCYAAFQGAAARDFTPADLSKIVSSDGGKTWSAPEIFIKASDHDAMNVMSVSLLRMQNGDIGLFYLVRKSWTDMRVVLRRSSDEGKTWSPSVCCIPRTGYFVMNNDRALRLSTGRIVLPVAEHDVCEKPDGTRAFSPARVSFFFSDDDGASWQESAQQLNINETGTVAGLQEPGVVALKDGTLYGWARTDLCVQYIFASSDQGVTWSAPRPSHFTSPLSPMSIKRLLDGRLLSLWNPIPEYNTRCSDRRTGGRTPFVYALSNDEGKTWSAPVAFESERDAGYCYTAIHPMEGGALLAYCAGHVPPQASCLNLTRIRFLRLAQEAQQTKTTVNPMGIGF